MFISDHMCIIVTDLETECSFYEKALDFKRKSFVVHNERASSVFMYDADKGFQIQLITFGNSESESNKTGHFAVHTSDIAVAYKRHNDMGCVVTPMITQKGQSSYFIADPEGYRIEIVEVK